MTNEQTYNRNQDTRRDARITDVIGSLMGLATAGTQFTFQQMRNAITMFREPQSAMNSVRDSLDSISKAMKPEANKPAEWKNAVTEPQPAEEALSGRKA